MTFAKLEPGDLFTCERLTGVWVKSASDRASMAGHNHIWGLVGQSEPVSSYSLPATLIRSVETVKISFMRRIRRLLGF